MGSNIQKSKHFIFTNLFFELKPKKVNIFSVLKVVPSYFFDFFIKIGMSILVNYGRTALIKEKYVYEYLHIM